jgi:hypothetical protein
MLSEKGIWARSTNKFYQLETGNHTVGNPEERLKKILLQRRVIIMGPGQESINTYPFKFMTAPEAKEKGYEFVTIYLNKFIKSQVENKEEGNSGPLSSAWDKS